MRRRTLVGSVVAGFIVLGAITGGEEQTSNNANTVNDLNATSEIKQNTPKETKPKSIAKPKQICDGKKVTSDCYVGKTKYSSYIYHSAVPEKSHKEIITTYEKEVSGYCTLCVDGTYSPSCATGRGACSHHGGVAQWNAPRYSTVPKQTIKKVIDSPARKAYYEKVLVR